MLNEKSINYKKIIKTLGESTLSGASKAFLSILRRGKKTQEDLGKVQGKFLKPYSGHLDAIMNMPDYEKEAMRRNTLKTMHTTQKSRRSLAKVSKAIPVKGETNSLENEKRRNSAIINAGSKLVKAFTKSEQKAKNEN